MHKPATSTASGAVATRSLAPWALLAALLVVGVVCFFVFGDRVPSLLQALSER